MNRPDDPAARWSRRTAPQREADASRFFHDVADRRRAGPQPRHGTLHFLAAHPLRTLRALADVLRLPQLPVTVIPHTIEGAVLERALTQRHTRRRHLLFASVLVLPREPDGYLWGSARQTVRRMVRKAERAGITSRRVVDPVEQLELIRAADTWERANPNPLYRDAVASNTDCLRYRLWLVAYAKDGRPLAVSVTPMAAEWALLRYFRTIGAGAEQSLARYHLMQALAGHLVREGVRYLADETSPTRLPNGLRHYQRLLGFRLVRLRVRHGRAGGAVDS